MIIYNISYITDIITDSISQLIKIPSLHTLVFEIEFQSNLQELLTCFIARHGNRFKNLCTQYIRGSGEKSVGPYVNTIGCFDELPLINFVEKFRPRRDKIIVRSKSQRVPDDIARYREQNSIPESKLPIEIKVNESYKLWKNC